MSDEPAELPDVQTGVADLRAVNLGRLFDLARADLEETISRLVARADQPGRSVSGYNPQRLD